MTARKVGSQELTREMIMDAARDLFVQKGYQYVSMRQIAQKLQCSHGAIYYHFKNKAELFYTLVEEHFQLLDEKLDTINNLNLEDTEKFRQILFGYIEFGLTHQSHYEIMFLTKDEEVRHFINEGPNQTYEKFAQIIHRLCGQHLKIQEIWLLFLSLHGFVVHYLGHVTSFEEVEDLAHAHVNFLQKAIFK